MVSGSRHGRRLTALAALAAVGVLLLAPIPPGRLGIWQNQLLDFGHVPLFAALVLVLRVCSRQPLGLALGVAVAVAGLAELVQPWVGRTGEWADFLRGSLGALVAAAAVRAYESRGAPLRRVGYSALALALLVWPVVEIAPYVADTVEGRRAFPVLADFSTRRELLRWQCDQATLARVEGEGARLNLLPGPDPYSYAALRPAVSDFRGYAWLCYEFRAVGEPVDLVVSVRTGGPGGGGTTHADVGRRYAVGTHIARVDLAALAAGGRPTPLDRSDVRFVIFFVVRPREPRTIVLTRVWLEP